MHNTAVSKIFQYLEKNYDIYGPVQQENKETIIQKLKQLSEVDYSGKIPNNSYKDFFLLAKENLFCFSRGKWRLSPQLTKKIVLWCVNILDLQAIGLLDLVFADDIYYQKRRANIIVIGYSAGAPAAQLDYQIFHQGKVDNLLSHVPFDIFLEKDNIDQVKFYTGSQKGLTIMKKLCINIDENIIFTGAALEKGADQTMLDNQKIMTQSLADPIWLELGKICTACGKCSVVCPTCFCFELQDQSVDNQVFKTRCTSDCFRDDFARVAGNHNFLATISDKIRFWYEHKFSRIPEQYHLAGCVSCLRCHQVCPVDINIIQIWQRLKTNYLQNHHE